MRIPTGLAACLTALALCVAAAARAQPAVVPEIDLKLFEKSEVDRSKGCSVALWQANRDPERDKFAYVFIEQFSGPNHARQPARIKLGAQVVTLRRVAIGGRNNGYDLFEYQLYKLGDTDYVVLELKLGEQAGEAVPIESGTLSIVMRGRQVFRASVAGGAGCVSPAAAAPPNVEAMFRPYTVRAAQVPMAFSQAVRKARGCDAEVMATGISGFQLSEEAAIWQIPCERFAYQASAVYALVYLPDPMKNLRFLTFQAPKGHARSNDPGVLMNPQWDARMRTVTGVSLGRAAGDCGTLERHRVTAEGEFMLVEYRDKPACDGKATKPDEFPLVFRAR